MTDMNHAGRVLRPGRALPLALAFSAPLLLGACGLSSNENTAVATFAAASGAYAGLVTEELPQVRREVIALNKMSASLQSPEADQDFEEEVLDLDGPLNADLLAAPTKTARQLEAYSQALLALIGALPKDEINNSFASIAGQIAAVSKADPKIMTAIGKSGGTLTNLYLQNAQAEALRTLVPAHQDVIRESAELLDALFDPNGNRLTTAHDVALGRLEDRISNALAQQGQEATGQRRDNLIAAGELVLHAKARQKQLGTLPVLVGQKLIKAHEALVKSVTDLDYSFEDIVAFAAVVKEMAVSLDGLQNN